MSDVDDSEAVLPPFVEKTNQYLDNIIIMETEVKDILDIKCKQSLRTRHD